MMYWVSKIVIVIVIIVLCSVVSRKTAFSVDWLHQTTLHILHGAETLVRQGMVESGEDVGVVHVEGGGHLAGRLDHIE